MTKRKHPATRYERKQLEEKIKFEDKPKRRTGKVRVIRQTEEAEELDHELEELQVR